MIPFKKMSPELRSFAIMSLTVFAIAVLRIIIFALTYNP